jgi:biotin operon repressor
MTKPINLMEEMLLGNFPEGKWISGTELASKIGRSRGRVNHIIQVLRAKGYNIYGVQGKGYFYERERERGAGREVGIDE